MIKYIKKRLLDYWLILNTDKEKLFTRYYKNNTWGDKESRSGTGSTLEHSSRLRSQLPSFFQRHEISTILDAPCGDYNWFRYVERVGINYIGADIVKPMIDNNTKLYSDEFTKFIQLDITKDTLPNADLWLCRDCLFHLSERDIFLALDNFIKSDIPLLLTTTFPETEFNVNVPTGSFRLLNLEKKPFSFGTPIEYLVDSVETWQKRYLGLWTKQDVIDVIQKKSF